MKCQILFSGKNKKNIINLSSAENAQRVVKVNANSYPGKKHFITGVVVIYVNLKDPQQPSQSHSLIRDFDKINKIHSIQ